MYDALMLKICFRVSANVVRTPATCRHGHISAFECVYVSRAEYLEYTMLSSLFCLFPAPREEREVSNVLSSLWFHLHNGVLFVHMQICLIIILLHWILRSPRDLDWFQVINPSLQEM